VPSTNSPKEKHPHADLGVAVELCSGMGGIGIGIRALGFHIAKAYDSWTEAVAIYNRNFSGEIAATCNLLSEKGQELVRADYHLLGQLDLLAAGLPVVSVQAPFLCPAFWQTALPEWSGQLDGAAVEGVLAEAPSPIHAGAARAVALDIQAGSEARHRAQIAPLNPAAHPVVTTLTAGERVRLVGLRARPDGVLVPGVRTSCSGLTIYHSWPRDVKQQSLRRSTTTPNSMQLTALHAAADAGH